jgi:hypothetical protein
LKTLRCGVVEATADLLAALIADSR